MGELVSIITPSYNSSKYIAHTIDSVLAQTYKKWELIIIDDNSVDDSKKIIAHYVKFDSRIRLIELRENQGPAIARNIGIEEARGPYIAFLDSDDIWLPKKLELQINFMETHNISLCFSSYFIMDEQGRTIDTFIIPNNRVCYYQLLKTNFIGNLTAIYNAGRIGKVLMENIKHEDYHFWLKILKRIKYAYGLKPPLAKYRLRKHSTSANKIKAAFWQWNIYRNVERLSLFDSLYYFGNYIYWGIKKHRGLF